MCMVNTIHVLSYSSNIACSVASFYIPGTQVPTEHYVGFYMCALDVR